MKILYVANKPAVPVVDGGSLAMKQFIEVLTSEHNCDAFIISTHKHPFSNESKTYFSSAFSAVHNEEINTKINPLKLIIQTVFGKSYVLNRFRSQKLTELLSNSDYDLIVCDSLFALYSYLNFSEKKSKVCLRSHNVEFEIWETRAEQSTGFKKWLFKRQASILKQKEIELLQQVDYNFCISDNDKAVFGKYISTVKHITLPININEKHLEVSKRECYFLGSNNWQPNIETVEYLVKTWSKKEFEGYKLKIGGGFDTSQFKTSENPNIEFHGHLENVDEFAADSGILVAPTFSGSGIRVKILEALALGIPTITTNLGASGISDEAGLIIVSNGQQLLDAIIQLKEDSLFYQSKSSMGKQYIQKYHSFDAAKQKLNQAFGR